MRDHLIHLHCANQFRSFKTQPFGSAVSWLHVNFEVVRTGTKLVQAVQAELYGPLVSALKHL